MSFVKLAQEEKSSLGMWAAARGQTLSPLSANLEHKPPGPHLGLGLGVRRAHLLNHPGPAAPEKVKARLCPATDEGWTCGR